MREYFDADGNPITLLRLIKSEPEWAENQILERDKLELDIETKDLTVIRFHKDSHNLAQDNERLRETLNRCLRDMDNIDNVCDLAEVHRFTFMRQDLEGALRKDENKAFEPYVKADPETPEAGYYECMNCSKRITPDRYGGPLARCSCGDEMKWHNAETPDTVEPQEGEVCQQCGKKYQINYWAPDKTWEIIKPDANSGGDLGGGLLCIDCADTRAREHGIDLYWQASTGWWLPTPPSDKPPENIKAALQKSMDDHTVFLPENNLNYLQENRSILRDFQIEVRAWAAATFPTQSPESIIAHLAREVGELQRDQTPEEAADCFVLLLDYAEFRGFDLLNEGRRKFEICKTREWGDPDSEGVIEHIESDSSASEHQEGES